MSAKKTLDILAKVSITQTFYYSVGDNIINTLFPEFIISIKTSRYFILFSYLRNLSLIAMLTA